MVLAGNPRIAVVLKRFSIIRQIDEKADSNWAIWNGRLEYLKYLNERGLCVEEYCSYSLEECARKNRIDILKYSHEIITPITQFEHVFDHAADFGHLDLVKFLHSIGSLYTHCFPTQ